MTAAQRLESQLELRQTQPNLDFMPMAQQMLIWGILSIFVLTWGVWLWTGLDFQSLDWLNLRNDWPVYPQRDFNFGGQSWWLEELPLMHAMPQLHADPNLNRYAIVVLAFTFSFWWLLLEIYSRYSLLAVLVAALYFLSHPAVIGLILGATQFAFACAIILASLLSTVRLVQTSAGHWFFATSVLSVVAVWLAPWAILLSPWTIWLALAYKPELVKKIPFWGVQAVIWASLITLCLVLDRHLLDLVPALPDFYTVFNWEFWRRLLTDQMDFGAGLFGVAAVFGMLARFKTDAITLMLLLTLCSLWIFWAGTSPSSSMVNIHLIGVLLGGWAAARLVAVLQLDIKHNMQNAHGLRWFGLGILGLSAVNAVFSLQGQHLW